MTLKSEVLPAPLGPITANNSPGRTWNETSLSALTPSKRTETFSTESRGVLDPLETMLSLIGPTSFRDDSGEPRSYGFVLHPRASQDKTCARSRPAGVRQLAAPGRPFQFPARSRNGQARAPSAHFVLPVIRQYHPHLSQR